MHCQAIKDKVRNTTEERWGGIGFASDEIHKKYEDTFDTLFQRSLKKELPLSYGSSFRPMIALVVVMICPCENMLNAIYKLLHASSF